MRALERRWWTLLVVCTGIFMLLLDITIVNIALPDLARDLHASFSDLQWVIDAYALSLAALLLIAGSLALVGIVYGLIRGNPDGWSSTGVVAALAGGVALLVAFALAELRQQQPM